MGQLGQFGGWGGGGKLGQFGGGGGGGEVGSVWGGGGGKLGQFGGGGEVEPFGTVAEKGRPFPYFDFLLPFLHFHTSISSFPYFHFFISILPFLHFHTSLFSIHFHIPLPSSCQPPNLPLGIL